MREGEEEGALGGWAGAPGARGPGRIGRAGLGWARLGWVTSRIETNDTHNH
jgi:hypothetical protein